MNSAKRNRPADRWVGRYTPSCQSSTPAGEWVGQPPHLPRPARRGAVTARSPSATRRAGGASGGAEGPAEGWQEGWAEGIGAAGRRGAEGASGAAGARAEGARVRGWRLVSPPPADHGGPSAGAVDRQGVGE